MPVRRLTLKAVLLLGLALPTASAFAQSADNLFARKTVTIYIGNTSGGSYDLYGRMVARFLGKHLPGQPNVVATNMPGAGTLKAANFIYDVAPKDGTAIGIVTETLALEQAVANPAVQFDATKFLWMGRVASSNNIHFQWHTAKVQSLDEAMRTETPVAAAGAGNISEVVPNLLNKVLGTKFKVISGYPASAESMLAMERGEVEGAASSWAAVKTGKKAWQHDFQDSANWGPLLTTGSGLIFAGGTSDRKFRALDGSTGKVLWETRLNSGVTGVPSSYMVDGIQYIAVQAGWGVDAERMLTGINALIPEERRVSVLPQGGVIWVFRVMGEEAAAK